MDLYKRLQRDFRCGKCGHCCSVGGDMVVTQDDLDRIVAYLELTPEDIESIFYHAGGSRYRQYKLRHTQPCYFLDKLDHTCTIHEVKPQACRDYPFTLYATRGCTFDGAFSCPRARGLLYSTMFLEV